MRITWSSFGLTRINKAYYLPRWCSTADYVKYFEEEGLVDVKRADWTDNIQVREDAGAGIL